MAAGTTAEEKIFHETTAEFIAAETPVAKVRELNESGGSFDRDWWRRAAELGWTSLLVPEEQGGGSVSGRGVVDLVGVAEALGTSVAPGPLHPVSAVLAALTSSAGGPEHTGLVDSLVAGETVAAWAAYEPGRSWCPLEPITTARPADGGYILDGVKDRVESGPEADVLLVTAATPSGPRQFVVDPAADGVAVERTASLDAVKTYATVRLDGTAVGTGSAVGTPETASEAIRHAARIASLLQTADTVGAVGTVFDFTIQWGFDRFSFGRPLASYQALKHRYADMKLWLEACRATVAGATEAVQDDRGDADYLVSVAASYVGQRSVQIIQDCVQLHGGIGVTWEHDLHLYLRRATLNRQLYGTPGEHRRLIADHLGM